MNVTIGGRERKLFAVWRERKRGNARNRRLKKSDKLRDAPRIDRARANLRRNESVEIFEVHIARKSDHRRRANAAATKTQVVAASRNVALDNQRASASVGEPQRVRARSFFLVFWLRSNKLDEFV